MCTPATGREYLSLDDSATLAAAVEPQTFILSLKNPVVIDEVQRSPGLFRAIKLAVDERRNPGRFLLTGSTNVQFLPELSDALVGRVELVPLWPLSQGEIDGTHESFIDVAFAPDPVWPQAATPSRGPDLIDRMVRGGFPEAVSRTDPLRRQDWFASYFTTILERGVRDIAAVDAPDRLSDLMALVASRSGGVLNASDLARTLGLPLTSVKRYLGMLRAVFMVVLLPAWSSNRGLRLAKAPKVLVGDSGLACHLEHADALRIAADGRLRGRMIETFVALELIKQAGWSVERPEFSHYRTLAGAEVDLVLERRGGDLVGIEVKSGVEVSGSDFNGLRSLADAAEDKFLRGVVLYGGEQTLAFGPKMWAVPISALWGAAPATA
jgi:uncharacterized protein